MGQAASMGAFLLAAGTKGMRYSLPNSRIMIRASLLVVIVASTDIDIHAREILRLKQHLNEILQKTQASP